MIVVWVGSQSEENGVDQTLMGYILVSLATVLFAIYEVIFKKYGSSKSNKEEKVFISN